jgi:hypothetical protein
MWGLFRTSHVDELKGKVAVSAANFLVLPEYRKIFPWEDPNTFRSLANFITTQAGLRPGMWDDRFVRMLADTVPENGPYGFVDQIAVEAGKIAIRGWAYMKEQQQAADAVIITGANPGETPRVLAVAFPSLTRPDVAAATRTDPALETG